MSRRQFLQQASALGAVSLVGMPATTWAEPRPEVRKIRLINFPAICLAPGYLAQELLHAEGFEEVEYVDLLVNTPFAALGSGRADIWVDPAPSLVNMLDTQETVVALAGVHSGCYELLAKAELRTIRDLKGRSVSISTLGSTEHVFVSSMAAYVGLDPRRDISWRIMESSDETMNAFIRGDVDAFLGFAPQPQELRALKIGHVIVNTTHDRPWSQYFCCMLAGNLEFVRRNPIATKRAMRAFLKAVDICTSDPVRAARFMVDKGYVRNYQIALEILGELPYRRWREENPEDTMRFHALRLRDVGMIKSTPQQIIDRGSDWRFLIELKREMKA